MSEELAKKYKGFCEPGQPLHGLFSIHKVEQCNFQVDGVRGHPFTIGPEHVAYASDHCGGILGTDVCERIPCAHQERFGRKCGRPYHAHTSDLVLFLVLARNLDNKEAAQAIYAIKDEMVADKIDGIAFMENGFRIAKPGEESS